MYFILLCVLVNTNTASFLIIYRLVLNMLVVEVNEDKLVEFTLELHKKTVHKHYIILNKPWNTKGEIHILADGCQMQTNLIKVNYKLRDIKFSATAIAILSTKLFCCFSTSWEVFSGFPLVAFRTVKFSFASHLLHQDGEIQKFFWCNKCPWFFDKSNARKAEWTGANKSAHPQMTTPLTI